MSSDEILDLTADVFYFTIMFKVNHSKQELLLSCVISCDYCCVTFVSLFMNLRHPLDIASHISRRGTLYTNIHTYTCVFLARRHFCSPGRGSFLVLSASWHAGRPPGPHEPARTQHASLDPGRGLWLVLWGFKVPRPLGEAFRARRTTQVPANPRTGQNNVRRLMSYLVS